MNSRGGSHLNDAAVVHEDHLVGNLSSEADLVGHNDHGHSAAREVAHHLEDLAHHLRVEGRGGLIEQHQLGIHCQCPSDGHPLLLAPGKLMWIGVRLGSETHLLEQRSSAGRGLCPGHLADSCGSQAHVLQRSLVREQIEALEHQADVAAARRDLAFVKLMQPVADPPVTDHRAVDDELAGVDPLEVVHTAEERALAGSGGPDQAHDLSRVDREGDAFEHIDRTEALVHVDRLDHRRDSHAAAANPASTGRTGRPDLRPNWPPPEANLRSRKHCPMLANVVSSRYQMLATMRSSITR